MENQENILEAKHISKSYNNKLIVKDVSISLKKGEVVGLLGPNGAGKTTCFTIMAGLIKSDAGKVYIKGKDVTHMPMYLRARMGLSYLPHESSIFKGLNVFENIESIVETRKDISKHRIESEVEDLLEEFKISHLQYVPSTALSAGERRRLEIARIVALNPECILFDEPLVGVDPIAISDIRELIEHLRQRNIGILITDHNVGEMLKIVDRAYIVYSGTVLVEGTPDVIVKNKKAVDIYLGESFRIE